jgi:dipeptidyl aminopeptidase/acylaminoacyl peptidase
MRFDGTGTTSTRIPFRPGDRALLGTVPPVYVQQGRTGLDNTICTGSARIQTRRLTSFAEKEFGPSPRPGLPSLLYTEGASPSTGRITLVPDTAATTVTRLYLTPSNLVAGEGSWDASGNRVCYAVEDPDGSKHIWTLTLAGTSVVSSLQMTTGADHDSSPRFSPDGKRILFVSDRGGRSGVWWTSDTGEANGLERIGYEDPGATIRAPLVVAGRKANRALLGRPRRRAIWVLSNLGFLADGPSISPAGQRISGRRQRGSLARKSRMRPRAAVSRAPASAPRKISSEARSPR